MKEKIRKKERTLYECSHARVRGDRIFCCKGHLLLKRMEDGAVDIKRLASGRPLVFKVCQCCLDFDFSGPPIPPEERGWLREGGLNEAVA